MGGVHPGGAISKPANWKAGATMQPTRLHAPMGSAACQAWAGTTAWDLTVTDTELQRVAGMEIPYLDRVHPVPVRAFARGQQIIDGGADTARAILGRMAIGLDVMAALRMGHKPQPSDDLRRFAHSTGSVSRTERRF